MRAHAARVCVCVCMCVCDSVYRALMWSLSKVCVCVRLCVHVSVCVFVCVQSSDVELRQGVCVCVHV